MRSLVCFGALSLLAACEWTPPVTAGDSGTPAGVILGEVMVVGPDQPADTYVLLYDATNPGPPSGLGGPINFDVIPAEAFEQDPLGSWTAPYAFTEVPGGAYLISALHDEDGDFSPVVDIAGGSTCGDWGGGYVGWVEDAEGNGGPDTTSFTLEEGQLLDGVPAVVQVQIPVEKPAFTILGGDGLPASGQVGLARDGTLHLASTVVGTEYLTLGPLQDLDDKSECGVAFTFYPLVSYDATGAPSVDGFIPPDVFLTQILDDAALARGDTPIVIQGIVEYDFLALVGQLLVNDAFPGESLDLTVRFAEDGQYFLPFSDTPSGSMSSLPDGPWAVTVVNVAGQTWTVPNTFGAGETNPTGGFVPATQNAKVVLQ